MKKIKRTSTKVIKRLDGDVYQFVKGVARVPGVRFRGEYMFVTLKQFNQFLREGTL